MCWGMEPSTRPAKRSKSKRLSSDYGKRLCQRLWDAYGAIASRKNPRRKSNRKPARKNGRNVACLRAGPFAASGRILGGALAQSARRHSAHGIAGRARRAQDARKRVYPIGCMWNIKAAHNALQGHCERCGIFCGYGRNGAGMPTARENGRRRGERAPGVRRDGRAVLRGAGRLLGRSGTACRDQA